MRKTHKATLIALFLTVTFIEGGLRLFISQKLNEIKPNAQDYTVDVMVYDFIGSGYAGCTGHSAENYLSVSYALWIIKDVLWANMMCKQRSAYISITTWTKKNSRIHDDRAFIFYHWSFKKWGFIDSEFENKDEENEQ